MRLVPKSEVSEMYCAFHNADCPARNTEGDPIVVNINPGYVPSKWICPQGVQEIAEFAADTDLDKIIETNEEEYFDVPEKPYLAASDAIQTLLAIERGREIPYRKDTLRALKRQLNEGRLRDRHFQMIQDCIDATNIECDYFESSH